MPWGFDICVSKQPGWSVSKAQGTIKFGYTGQWQEMGSGRSWNLLLTVQQQLLRTDRECSL